MSLLEKLKIVPVDQQEIDPETEQEISQVFQQDPEPRDSTSPRRKPAPRAQKAPTRRVSPSTTKLAKEVSEDLTSLIEASAAVWGMTDQCCAPTLERQAEPIAKSLTAILSRNPRLLAKFADADIVAYTLQTVALLKALEPVGKEIYKNHVSGAVDENETEEPANAIHLSQFPPASTIPRAHTTRGSATA